jgi:hypothetical protein
MPENAYKYIKALECSADKLKVYVMDDGAMDSVKKLAASYGFEYIRRDDGPRLKKAGKPALSFCVYLRRVLHNLRCRFLSTTRLLS